MDAVRSMQLDLLVGIGNTLKSKKAQHESGLKLIKNRIFKKGGDDSIELIKYPIYLK